MTESWPTAPLPWQQGDWSQIEELIVADRLPQAFLLTGSAGIGKRHFLRSVAARVMCADPVAGTACGRCRGCSLLAAGSHSDYLEVGAEEGSRVIKVDQIRHLINFSAKTPSLGRHKVILLGPAEIMNLNAANALLKCLEEPGENTHMLLYSHQPAGIPATVRSRCQRLSMAVPELARSLPWLTGVTGSESTARKLLQVCGQRPLDACDLFQADGLDQYLAIHEDLLAIAEGRLSPLEFPARVSELELDAVLALLQGYLEETIRRLLSGGDTRVKDVFLLRDELARQKNALARGANPNRQLIIEDCATRLHSALGATRS